MIEYLISYQHPHQQFIDITLSLDQIAQPLLYLQLPSWRPGRYELGNFAKNIQRFTVEDDEGHTLPFRKITKDRWEVQTASVTGIRVKYNYYAAVLDAGSTWLDQNQLYVNFVNCLLYVEGRMEVKHRVKLLLPEAYTIACGLPQTGRHVLESPNFYQLAESPMIASAQLTHWTYQIDAHTFHLWIQGTCRLDQQETLARFEAFTREQIATMGDFPCQDYHFLFHFLPYRAYHGVEHFNSTVITLGPAEQLVEDSRLYEDLLGISSHELFHTWNIIRIRPAEMMPYDYTRENYFQTGFIAEGVTTYYGDLFLVRSGVISRQEYFLELNKLFKRHFENFGRFNHSLADSSFDLWLDGYSNGIPNRKVSIYVKGALISLILDLELRQISNHQQSLDTFVRYLWDRFGKSGQGYSIQDLQQLIAELSNEQLPQYFEEYVFGTVPLEHKLQELLQSVGCCLRTYESAFVAERRFGFRTAYREGKLVITAIEPQAVAANQLRIDDEIIAVNGRKVGETIDELLVAHQEVELAVFRNHYLHAIHLVSDGRSYFKQYVIEQKTDATNQEKENFFQWLRCEW